MRDAGHGCDFILLDVHFILFRVFFVVLLIPPRYIYACLFEGRLCLVISVFILYIYSRFRKRTRAFNFYQGINGRDAMLLLGNSFYLVLLYIATCNLFFYCVSLCVYNLELFPHMKKARR